MIYWSAVFFIVMLIAAVLGFGSLALVIGPAAEIARVTFFIFLVAFVVTMSMAIFRREPY